MGQEIVVKIIVFTNLIFMRESPIDKSVVLYLVED